MNFGSNSLFSEYRAIELSHDLFPGEEEYNFEVNTRFVDELLPEYKRAPDSWYVMSEVEMWSHVGTHMESPSHYLKNGEDIAEISLNKVIGETVIIDFTDKKILEPITDSDLNLRGGKVQPGDIVFIRTGLSNNYRTERSHDRPYFTVEAIGWFVNKKIHCLGVDCSGIEKRDLSSQPAHELLFSNGIPLIEHLTNLDKIKSERFFIVAVPLRVHGLEAFPVSVVAFEKG